MLILSTLPCFLYNESIGIISSQQKLLVKTQKHSRHQPKSVQNQRVVDQQHNLILSLTSQSLKFCSQGFTKFCKREIFLKQKPRIDSRRVSVEHTFLRHSVCAS